MAFNSLQKLRGNIEAIRIALAYEQGDQLSDVEIATPQAYAGLAA